MSSGHFGKCLGTPVCDVIAHSRAVVRTAMLHFEIGLGEHAQMALGAVHGLIIGEMRVEGRNLAVILAMGDQEGHLDLLDLTVERDLVGIVKKRIAIIHAEHPQHVVPIMRYGVFPLVRHALALALAGSCAGFLVWNRFPARIYMGDSGSLFIGFMLAAIGVRINLVNLPALNAIAIPVIVLALPILDTSLVVTSRISRGISPFVGGLDHLAHRLRRTGLDTQSAVRRIWFGGVLASGSALALSRLGAGAGAVLVAVCAVAFGAIFLYAYRLPETGDLPRS